MSVHLLLQGRSRRSAALCVQATVAERLELSASPYIHEPGRGLGFYTGTDGYLYVDNLRIDDIRAQVRHTTLTGVAAQSMRSYSSTRAQDMHYIVQII